MRLSERVLLILICGVTVLILYAVIQSKLNYNALQDKYELLRIKNKELKMKQRMRKNFKSAKIKSMAKNEPPKMRHREVNEFEDMHQFSIFNPTFRKLMEWPPKMPMFPKNPNLAELLNITITSDMSNWEKFNLQMSKLYVYEEDSEVVEELLQEISTLKIVKQNDLVVGRQFKLLVTFENGAKAVFKPQRFARGTQVNENVLYYSDFERHNSEIAAYHLDKILGFRKVPPVVGRLVNITKEILPLADEEFMTTFYYSPDGNYCFHGNCALHCNSHHPFCGNPDMIEGSFAVWMEYAPHLQYPIFVKNPWKRSYKSLIKEEWEENFYFCPEVAMETPPFDEVKRIYDVVDSAIFDFLIGNMDRHNFEYYGVFGNDSFTTFIHMDNGKGFGRPEHDELSILTPLSQCCMVRLSTFNKLYNFYIGERPLSDLMRDSLSADPLSPVLSEPHLQAMDRRVEGALDAIRSCIKANFAAGVFLDDIV